MSNLNPQKPKCNIPNPFGKKKTMHLIGFKLKMGTKRYRAKENNSGTALSHHTIFPLSVNQIN